jgi:hypothetical protein
MRDAVVEDLPQGLMGMRRHGRGQVRVLFHQDTPDAALGRWVGGLIMRWRARPWVVETWIEKT